MIICGLKITHDGSIAVIKENKLLFSLELEKVNNNLRFESIEDTDIISDELAKFGLSVDDIDVFALDGWGGNDQEALAIQPRLTIGKDHNFLSAFSQKQQYQLGVAQYTENSLQEDILKPMHFSGLKIKDREFDYESYSHVAGHVMSSYCTSPFAAANENAFVLIWDGGMYPRLYHFDQGNHTVKNLGPLFLLIGNIYTIFSQHFGPFKVSTGFAKDSLSIAGKVMAYIAYGKVQPELINLFDDIYREHYTKPMGFANIFANEFKKAIKGKGYSDSDILRTFHQYVEQLLVEKLQKKIKRSGFETENLCIAGGCGLNIKWNSAIRSKQIVKNVYVPPFPNDSGSAIGVACAAYINATKKSAIDWTVYSGPDVITSKPVEGWSSKTCDIKELAALLHEKDEPVVVLNGRAELGPRALGNRSIIAPAVSPRMKSILNKVKQREDYRPVAPICLEEKASQYFDPGSHDPYMIFDHIVREEYRTIIPAILHLDDTARLQTVNSEDNPEIAELLREYEKLSGLAVLCNTSANFKGKGFFPDVHSATSWNETNFVWSNGILYEKDEKINFQDNK